MTSFPCDEWIRISSGAGKTFIYWCLASSAPCTVGPDSVAVLVLIQFGMELGSASVGGDPIIPLIKPFQGGGDSCFRDI